MPPCPAGGIVPGKESYMNYPATPFSSSEEWAKFRTEQFEILRSEEAEEDLDKGETKMKKLILSAIIALIVLTSLGCAPRHQVTYTSEIDSKAGVICYMTIEDNFVDSSTFRCFDLESAGMLAGPQ